MSDSTRIEYPDEAGYPDGMGFLDEGTRAPANWDAADALTDLSTDSADRDADVSVRRLDQEHLYVAELDGARVAELRFAVGSDATILVGTHVAVGLRGRGIGTALIAYTLDDLRSRGVTVVAQCPVVGHFVEQHPEYMSLLAVSS